MKNRCYFVKAILENFFVEIVSKESMALDYKQYSNLEKSKGWATKEVNLREANIKVGKKKIDLNKKWAKKLTWLKIKIESDFGEKIKVKKLTFGKRSERYKK